MTVLRPAILALSLLCGGLSAPVMAERLADLANIGGVRVNQLVGYGLVVGLDGTGDKANSSPFMRQSMINMLNQMGIMVPPDQKLDPKNAAAVMVTAVLPPFASPGQQIDVVVSALGDAKSLRGGTLLMTQLKGADGQTYGIAQGNLVVGGAGASAGGSSAKINQLNGARIPAGATVERAVPTAVGDGDVIVLELKQASFTNAARTVNAINSSMGSIARAMDGSRIEVRAPMDPNARVAFLSRLENLNVSTPAPLPRVVINARTGSVVMNQTVTVEPCAVAHGNLTVTVQSTPVVSQPNAFSQGQTVAGQQADISINQQGGRLINVPRGSNLNEIVRALNAVGATPQDLLSILTAMKAAGALKAELEVI
ncbi:flagellar basal body P-ring protein FlgI [Laribacter hongkongensis]|uniref:Flagellar P-ring protein n=1 Tax=Laribacter hongkongensis TaxID=168471 RepID=A0A248LF54_9NEIS|nr:flagellar basal body P-ring protein FlgI [Laribacter hongkongensis]ASJ23242.1 flagellar P-ring protein FlgI [Laribacter hongkongensis]MCG9025978.1 flagellar basal body P-ring protein FlgI [Laribacter hongkongensis]MCG9058453.1 flagellar basal body P-ring protein FlgI [Laribacter hongkongensis]MCG9064620.1 flagellar basal body P-ring protein FlgI [Laribacter hongkongensis]MCG9078238.1 flagellar basal body P-ring protein FlgI [Laribacter hongkongensis]